MPIYEYRCRKCGHRFEELVGVGADESKLACPKCRAARPDRQFSAFGFKSTGADGSSVSRLGGGCSSCTASSCTGCKTSSSK